MEHGSLIDIYELSDLDYLKSIWASLIRLEQLLGVPPTIEAPPATVVVEPPDFSEIVTAVTGLRPSATAAEIAAAIADVLRPGETENGAQALSEVAEALRTLDHRLQGLGRQAYGGGTVSMDGPISLAAGSVTIGKVDQGAGGTSAWKVDGSAVTQPVSHTYLGNQVGTWGYYGGASGTVVVDSGRKVIGIAAHATTPGSMTINSGDSVPLPANVQVNIGPLGNLVAPTLVFTGTDSYFVETLA